MGSAPGDPQAGPARGAVRDRRRELGALYTWLEHGPRSWELDPARDAEQRGFAGPGGPGDTDDLAGMDREAGVAQRRDRAAAVGYRHPVDGYDRRGGWAVRVVGRPSTCSST